MPNRRQAIIWTNAVPINWRKYASLGGDELITQVRPYLNQSIALHEFLHDAQKFPFYMSSHLFIMSSNNLVPAASSASAGTVLQIPDVYIRVYSIMIKDVLRVSVSGHCQQICLLVIFQGLYARSGVMHYIHGLSHEWIFMPVLPGTCARFHVVQVKYPVIEIHRMPITSHKRQLDIYVIWL